MNSAEEKFNQKQCRLSYGEEEWIDCILKHIEPERSVMMNAHAETCLACRETIAYWKPLIAPNGDNNQSTEGMLIDIPDNSSYTKLRRTVMNIGLRRRAAGRWKRLAQGAAALAFIAAVAWSLPSLYSQVGKETGGVQNDYVAHYEPRAARFINDPDTASYRISSEYGESRESYVWFNGRSGEMLVLVDGLLPSSGYAIQAWAISDNDHVNLGLLRQLELRRAHLYVKRTELADFDNVALTIEPDGGSQEPTTPDIMFIRLR